VWSRILGGFAGDPRRVERAVSLLSRIVPAWLLVLVGATWPLWTPGGDFPRVPLVGWFAGCPAWFEWIALGCFVLAAVGATIWGAKQGVSRWSAVMTALAFGVLVLADQHRLQPWAYQLVLMQIVLAAPPAVEALALTRLFVASIYFFSALSKLDRSFIDAGGGLIVEGLLNCLGLVDRVGTDRRMLIAAIVAAGELSIAAGLCWRRSRKFAWPASIALHGLLLAALGPWGAQSKPAVLLWNVYFVLQNSVLFGLAGERPIIPTAGVLPATGSQSLAVAATHRFAPVGGLRWLVRGIATFAILFPLTEPIGLCDVWPAWAVYATGPERLRVLIAEADRDQLPAAARKYVQPPRYEDGLCLVRIDRWSLDLCKAPLYPQNRFRLGVALAIADRAALGDRILVELDSAANRFTGERTSRQLKGRAAIVAELERYWLNGFPRVRDRSKPPDVGRRE
jgi:hypothetical protein